MNRAEALELVEYVHGLWPNWRLPGHEGAMMLTVEGWWRNLRDIDRDVAFVAVDTFTEGKFPPSVGEVHRAALDLLTPPRSLPDWDTFWQWARTQVARCTLYLLERRPTVECPWPEFDGIVTADWLSSMARAGVDGTPITEHDLELVAQAHMRRRYDAAAARAQVGRAPVAASVVAWRAEHLDPAHAAAIAGAVKQLEAGE